MLGYFSINRIFIRNMSQSVALKLINNAEKAENRLAELRSRLEGVRKVKILEKIRELTQENDVLVAKVERTRAELIRLETLNGKKQYPIPGRTATSGLSAAAEVLLEPEIEPTIKKEKNPKKKEKVNSAPTSDNTIDVSKLDFRIGKIIEIHKHPDADTLYVEKIDCGEENPRTVVSGLVHNVPIEEMRDRIVMVICNLKPVKMRGVTSEAMVMCAVTPEKVEVLIPPVGSIPGDLVSCEGYPREPEPLLNPKKKIFETCAPDLKTNDDRIACYKEKPLVVPGKGPVFAATLKGVSVK